MNISIDNYYLLVKKKDPTSILALHFNTELDIIKKSNVDLEFIGTPILKELIFEYNPYIYKGVRIPEFNPLQYLQDKEQEFLSHLTEDSYNKVKEAYKQHQINQLKRAHPSYEELAKLRDSLNKNKL